MHYLLPHKAAIWADYSHVSNEGIKCTQHSISKWLGLDSGLSLTLLLHTVWNEKNKACFCPAF